MLTLVAITVLGLSLIIVLGNLRMVAQDTVQMVAASAARARADGTLNRRIAFIALWGIVFMASFF